MHSRRMSYLRRCSRECGNSAVFVTAQAVSVGDQRSYGVVLRDLPRLPVSHRDIARYGGACSRRREVFAAWFVYVRELEYNQSRIRSKLCGQTAISTLTTPSHRAGDETTSAAPAREGNRYKPSMWGQNLIRYGYVVVL